MRDRMDARGVRMSTHRYVELQTTSHFSFLRGASSADELFAQAAMQGIEALVRGDIGVTPLQEYHAILHGARSQDDDHTHDHEENG